VSRGPTPTRALLTACLVGSAVVHAATLGMLAYYKPALRDRVSDVATSDEPFTTLTLAPRAEPAPKAEPPAPPPPKPEAPPEVKDPEPPKPAPKAEILPVAKTDAPRAIISYAPIPPPRDDAPAQPEPARPTQTTSNAPTSGARTNSDDVPRGTTAVFAGVQAKAASRIVYAVDASGAMASSLPFVLDEVMRSVNRLSPSQKFQVVLFRESPDGSGAIGPLVFGTAMMPANDANRVKLARWLRDIQPAGRSNPLTGLEPALAFQPDLIFLLTRSIKRSGPSSEWGPGNRAVLQRLDQLNPRNDGGLRPVVIKTIQFLDADPTGLLQAIADAHGDGPGSSRTLSLEELQER